MARPPTTTTLRQAALDTRTVVLLVRTFTPKLLKGLIQDLALEDQVRRRLSRRRRGMRPLKLGAFAVGIAAAGAATAGLAWRFRASGGDGPESDTA